MTAKRTTLSLTILVCALALGLVLMNRNTASASFAVQAQGDKPVEQTRKNIQVLKGLPESQIFPLMNFVATSLDVHCDYCHVREGKNPQTGSDNWIWDRDDKPKKLIARRMMKMVMDINGTNFSGETFVTCYTCHRGSTVPGRLPPLPPHDPIRTETAALPTAEQILAKYVAAVGGKDAATKFKTTVMKGTIERAEGRNADDSLIKRERPLEVTLKDADKYLITWATPQGVTTSGLNSESGWIKTNAGTRKLSGRDFEPLKRAAAYYGVIKVVEQPAQMKVLGTEKIGDREAYVLALVIDPNRTTKFFFDTQTGLLLRELTTTRTILVPLPDQVDFEDYRDVDGIKLPFAIRTSDASVFSTTTRRFTEIKHKVAVDDNIFNLPPK